MKLKYYLRGLSVGILFSTIILSIAFRASSKEKADKVNLNTSNTSGTEATDGDVEIKDLEDLLNPSVTPSAAPTVVPTEEEAKDKDETDTSSAEPSVTPTEVDAEEDADKSDDELITDKTDQAADSKEQKEAQDYVIIRIEKGMTSEQVSSILYNYGLIENKNDFNNYMKDHDYSRIINVGDFKISKNATYEQITDLIVEK
jgi:hypothetical protein